MQVRLLKTVTKLWCGMCWVVILIRPSNRRIVWITSFAIHSQDPLLSFMTVSRPGRIWSMRSKMLEYFSAEGYIFEPLEKVLAGHEIQHYMFGTLHWVLLLRQNITFQNINLPSWKSSNACINSARVFITKGPCVPQIGSLSGAALNKVPRNSPVLIIQRNLRHSSSE